MQKILISLDHFYTDFANSPGVVGNTALYHEVTRQVFDCMDEPFPQFVVAIGSLPKFKLLPYFHNSDNIDLCNIMRSNTQSFALGVWSICYTNGLFLHGEFPFLLETIYNDTCLLYPDVKRIQELNNQ